MKTNEPTQSVRRRARLRALSLALLLLLFPIVQAAALDADALVPIGRTGVNAQFTEMLGLEAFLSWFTLQM